MTTLVHQSTVEHLALCADCARGALPYALDHQDQYVHIWIEEGTIGLGRWAPFADPAEDHQASAFASYRHPARRTGAPVPCRHCRAPIVIAGASPTGWVHVISTAAATAPHQCTAVARGQLSPFAEPDR